MKNLHTSRATRVREVYLNFANSAGGKVFGGPFSEWRGAKRLPKVLLINMAEEARQPADITVPTQDFGVPPMQPFKSALVAAAQHLLKDGSVFVGCGYGIGRTGTFLAGLCKLHQEVLYLLRQSNTFSDHLKYDAVQDVRDRYLRNAVETQAQREFVERLDVTGMARRIAFRLRPTVVFDKRFWGR